LNNNILIEDHDDVFTYPQKAHSKFNANRVRIDTDGTRSQGTFFSKMGKTGAWGLAVSHAALKDSSEVGFKSNGGGETPVTAHQVLDFFYSGGGRKAWGLRLTIGSGGAVGQTDQSNFNFGIAGGYSTKGKFAMDIGAKLHYAGVSVEDEGEGQVIDFAANFRGYMKGFQPNVDMGLIGSLSYLGRAHVADQSNIADESDTTIGLNLGAGPVFRLGKNKESTVSTYALIKLRHVSDTESEDTAMHIAIPEVNIAFETPVNDWLIFRGGIGYNFVIQSETPGADGADPTGRKTNTFGTDVVDLGGATSSIGLGGKWNALALDLAINKAWLTSGPYFLTGQSASLWASKAAVSYNW
jgi:hypothetical protein